MSLIVMLIIKILALHAIVTHSVSEIYVVLVLFGGSVLVNGILSDIVYQLKNMPYLVLLTWATGVGQVDTRKKYNSYFGGILLIVSILLALTTGFGWYFHWVDYTHTGIICILIIDVFTSILWGVIRLID